MSGSSGGTGEPTDPDWQACLDVAVTYHQRCIDEPIDDHSGNCDHPECTEKTCSRPTTAYEYFSEDRGWDDDTIRTARLGYAPPGDDLVIYLHENGFPPEDLRATGLFTQDLRPLWEGRYVIPYLDRDGNPIYAISRTTAGTSKGQGSGHPDDDFPNKYANLAHTKAYAEVRPAPYGLHSLEKEHPAIVAEGLPDALSAYQAGWPTVSAGALSFSEHSFEWLVEELRALDISCICAIGDADPPTVYPSEDGDQLVTSQVGPGVQGAFRTATQLAVENFDVYLTTVPLIGSNALDLDEFVQEEWGTLDALRRSAVPPSQH